MLPEVASKSRLALEADNHRLRQENARLRHKIEMAAYDANRLILTLQRLIVKKGAA